MTRRRSTPPVRITLRRATLRDLPVLVHQRHQMFVAMGSGTPRQLAIADAHYGRWIRRLMPRRRFLALLAVTPTGEVVAGGALWLQERPPGPGFAGGVAPYLMAMYTEPAYRGLGLASRIVTTTMRWSRARGYRRMTLHAAPMGRPVYERLGWAASKSPEYRCEL